MKAEKMVLANAFALTSAVIWVVCSAGVAFLPGITSTISKWLTHGIDMATLGGRQVTVEGFIFGGMTMVIFGWVIGYVLGWSIEYFSKKK